MRAAPPLRRRRAARSPRSRWVATHRRRQAELRADLLVEVGHDVGGRQRLARPVAWCVSINDSSRVTHQPKV